jgi:hypothetical protein
MGGRTKWVLISQPLVSSRSEDSFYLSAGSLEFGVGVGLGVDLFGTEGLLDFDAIVTSVQDILIIRSVKIRGARTPIHYFVSYNLMQISTEEGLATPILNPN